MAAQEDYPILASLAKATLREQEYGRALDEIDALRQVVHECWAWDDGDTLPGQLPELLESVAQRYDWLER